MSVAMEMPRYECHKIVHALKIGSIAHAPDGVITIEPSDMRYSRFEISREWYDKHRPDVGGYYVVYADDYKSYSPAKAFEEGYTLIR